MRISKPAVVVLGLAVCCGSCAPGGEDPKLAGETVSRGAQLAAGQTLTVELWRDQTGAVLRRRNRRLVRPGVVHPAIAKEARHQQERLQVGARWRKDSGPEALLGLGRQYFPELAPPRGERPPESEADRARLAAAGSLQLLPPTSASDPMTLVTRGLRFVVEPVASGSALVASPVERPAEGVWAYGTHRYLELMGARYLSGENGEGSWRGSRVEDFEVVERPAGEYQARYRVHLPAGIRGVKDAGAYLELSDGISWSPVLRVHRPEARDANGQARLGRIQLVGVRPVGPVAQGRYLVEGEVLELGLAVGLDGLAGPVVVDPGWSGTLNPAIFHKGHTATLLSDGQVLVTGGVWGVQPVSGGEELYDPASRLWHSTGALSTHREGHTATLLPDGRVLVVGGYGIKPDNSLGELGSVELYEPSTGTWSAGLPLSAARQQHTATLLANGQVLVTGGHQAMVPLGSAELYDPTTGQWSPAGPLATARSGHTATLLPDGTVLVTGGEDLGGTLKSAERFNPAGGSFSPAGAMSIARKFHPAVLLPSGKVLALAGETTADLYDPTTGMWSTQPGLPQARTGVSAAALGPSGELILLSVLDPPLVDECYGTYYSHTDWYDATTGTSLGGLDGRLVVGGHSLTLLGDGSVMTVVGSTSGTQWLHHDARQGLRRAGLVGSQVARAEHTATLLQTGRVLLAGGRDADGDLAAAHLYDPGADRLDPTGLMSHPRSGHTATLLGSGQVLVLGGGEGAAPRTAELYDRFARSFSLTGSPGEGRRGHTATLLTDGRVLVVGGEGQRARYAELYDPATGSFCWSGSLTQARRDHSATLLGDGRVLIVGGRDGDAALASTELYDPATGTFSPGPVLGQARYGHTAFVLESARVLVLGGSVGVGGEAEVLWGESFGTASGSWQQASILEAGGGRTITALANGWWLHSGAEVFSGTGFVLLDGNGRVIVSYPWRSEVSPHLSFHSSTLLRDGSVLIAGGQHRANPPTSLVARFQLGREPADALRPEVSSVSGLSTAGGAMILTGSGFRGLTQSGSGPGGTPTDQPIITLHRSDDGQRYTTRLAAFDAVGATVTTPPIPGGSYLVLVTVNGVSGGYGPVAVIGAPTGATCAAAPPPDPKLEPGAGGGTMASPDGGAGMPPAVSGCDCDVSGQSGGGRSTGLALALLLALAGVGRGLRRRRARRA